MPEDRPGIREKLQARQELSALHDWPCKSTKDAGDITAADEPVTVCLDLRKPLVRTSFESASTEALNLRTYATKTQAPLRTCCYLVEVTVATQRRRGSKAADRS